MNNWILRFFESLNFKMAFSLCRDVGPTSPYQDSSESAMRLNFGHLKVRLSRATFFGRRGGGGGGGGGCWVKMYQKLIT